MNTKIYALIGAALVVGILALTPHASGVTHTESSQTVKITQVMPHYAHVLDSKGEVSTVQFHERCTPKANMNNQLVNAKTIISMMNNGTVTVAVDRHDIYGQICKP